MGKKTTLYDVAKRAGVSHQTVSRVIKGDGAVAEKTRLRVNEAIGALNYAPSRAARHLASGRSGRILVLDTEVHSLVPLRTLTQRANQLDLDVGLAYLAPDSGEDAFAEQLNSLRDGSVDGALILKTSRQSLVDEFDKKVDRYDLVIIGDMPESASVSSIGIDNEVGMEKVFRHLYELGHRKILELRGPAEHHEAVVRHQRFLSLVREYRLDEYLSLEAGFEPDGGRRAIEAALREGWKFTAVAAASDGCAFGAIDALRNRGLSVPGDVSVVGYGDISYLRGYFNPPLTTVRQDFTRLAEEAVDLLKEIIAAREKREPVRRRLEPELIPGSTTSARAK